MQDESRYAVGIDIGTDNIRVIVAMGDGKTTPTIVGYGEYVNMGMRKGTIIDIDKTAEAVDRALAAAEKMSDHHVTNVTVGINGSHISGFSSRGVVAVTGKTIDSNDLARVEEAASTVQLPSNREILDITPRNYILDGQENIKNPLDMTGIRLEVDAYIISALVPHIKNIDHVLELTEIPNRTIILSGIAAARAVLSVQQRENGVVLVDIGGATTNIAVYEEGDLIHAAVLPVGSDNITNDLAIVLRTDLDIAEKVKVEYAVAMPSLRKVSGRIKIKVDEQMFLFDSEMVDEIVEARLEAIFGMVNDELRKINRFAKLPGGVVLTGGGAKLRGVAECAKENMQLAARVGKPSGFGGMGEQVADPAWSTAIGLMLIDFDGNALDIARKGKAKKSVFGKLFGRK